MCVTSGVVCAGAAAATATSAPVGSVQDTRPHGHVNRVGWHPGVDNDPGHPVAAIPSTPRALESHACRHEGRQIPALVMGDPPRSVGHPTRQHLLI